MNFSNFVFGLVFVYVLYYVLMAAFDYYKAVKETKDNDAGEDIDISGSIAQYKPKKFHKEAQSGNERWEGNALSGDPEDGNAQPGADEELEDAIEHEEAQSENEGWEGNALSGDPEDGNAQPGTDEELEDAIEHEEVQSENEGWEGNALSGDPEDGNAQPGADEEFQDEETIPVNMIGGKSYVDLMKEIVIECSSGKSYFEGILEKLN